jgi:hypothetical protein
MLMWNADASNGPRASRGRVDVGFDRAELDRS